MKHDVSARVLTSYVLTSSVLTRPLGASFADWFVLAALIVALVGYVSVTGADRPKSSVHAGPRFEAALGEEASG